ncbi:hypothetical protein [Pedobacter ureilyticus]|uniref:Sialidase domain-containing protein n=1 Tax=Pedobacter ureilyticus TaxID=1393051 RepID=A0ABW9J973_9SPHI|nr:hypothetical protein [Pedobacter helvus]
MERIGGDTILLVYHFGNKGNEWDNIGIRQSNDNGATWSKNRLVVADNQPDRYSGFPTPELLKLKNGCSSWPMPVGEFQMKVYITFYR